MKRKKAAGTEILPLFLWKYFINEDVFRNLDPQKSKKVNEKSIAFKYHDRHNCWLWLSAKREKSQPHGAKRNKRKLAVSPGG